MMVGASFVVAVGLKIVLADNESFDFVVNDVLTLLS
jgi:hypothetical protein